MNSSSLRIRKIRGGALLLIASFMIVSAVVRLGAEAGPVIARATSGLGAGMEDLPAHAAAPSASLDPRSDLGPLLEALSTREATVVRRERELEDRLQALRIAEKSVEERIGALQAAEVKLRGTLALADGASERDLAQLTSVYEQMKSKETAAVFEQMAPEFAAGFLARMRPEVAASVLEGMDPQAAYSISVVLAGRNMQVPRK